MIEAVKLITLSAFGLMHADAVHGVPWFKNILKGVIVITIEIEGLHTMDAGETREIFANGLHIRISASSPPVLENAQNVQCAGNDILDGCSNNAEDALQAMSYSMRKLRSKKRKKGRAFRYL